MYDAVYLAANDIMSKQKGRKAVVMLSDGRDTGSRETLGQAIESAQRADLIVYTVYYADEEGFPQGGPGYGGFGRRRGGMGGPMPRYPQSSQVDGKKILEQLSHETGGRLFEVSKKEPVDKVFSHIQEDLRNQYSLGYSSDQPAGSGYRKIAVTVKQKGLVVQARDGYYAEQK